MIVWFLLPTLCHSHDAFLLFRKKWRRLRKGSWSHLMSWKVVKLIFKAYASHFCTMYLNLTSIVAAVWYLLKNSHNNLQLLNCWNEHLCQVTNFLDTQSLLSAGVLTSVTPGLRRLGKDGYYKFEAILGYMMIFSPTWASDKHYLKK